MNEVQILGVGIHPLTMEQSLARIDGFIKEQGPHLVVTANSEMVMRANTDVLLNQILERADLKVPDGIGVVWASRILGEPIPERVPGIELMQNLLTAGDAKGYRVYFLGAEPGIADKVSELVQTSHPGIKVVGAHHGFFRKDQEEQVIADIKAVEPDILFLALGVPRQEKWAAAHLGVLQVPVAIGVGGSFNVFAGTDKRAPSWMQKTGLEWFYRLLRQPSRASRMAALPQFAVLVLLERMMRGKGDAR